MYDIIIWCHNFQSGCCKPPSSCNYMGTTLVQNPDCYLWRNDPNGLCYDCDSCKAGVLEEVRRDWHKLSALNVVMLVFLIGIYSIGCCAFRNTKRAETGYPYGKNRIIKVHPRWDFHWWVVYIYISSSDEYLIRWIGDLNMIKEKQRIKYLQIYSIATHFCYVVVFIGGEGGMTGDTRFISIEMFLLSSVLGCKLWNK